MKYFAFSRPHKADTKKKNVHNAIRKSVKVNKPERNISVVTARLLVGTELIFSNFASRNNKPSEPSTAKKPIAEPKEQVDELLA